MIAFIRSVSSHWRSVSLTLRADDVVRMIRPPIVAWLRWSPWISLAAVVDAMRRMAQ